MTEHGPSDIPPEGWLHVVIRVWKKTQKDQLSLLAAGVAFYAFMALFPSMVAAVLLYGIFANPTEVQRQVAHLSGTLPSGAVTLLTNQLSGVTTTSHASLGIGVVFSVGLALWSASGGVGNVMATLNIAYGAKETRNLVKRKLMSLCLTVAAIVFVIVTVTLIAVVPPLVGHLGSGGVMRWALEGLRLIGLVVAMVTALAVLYRVAPDRREREPRWITPGAQLATVVWVAASIAFSIYVDHFGSYNKTYGAMAGVVVLLLWLWLTVYLVLLGAAINAEAEAHADAKAED